MKPTNTPGAWAKLRNVVYLCAGIAVVAAMVLTMIGALAARTDSLLYCVLMPLALGSGFPHVWAILTKNNQKQALERAAWDAVTRPFQLGFQLARRQFYTSDRPHSLREVGAIGMNLTRTRIPVAGRQSGGRKTGAGGQKKPASSGSDDDGEPPANLPLVWTVHDLAQTLSVSAKTLQNKPASALPPAIRIPGCKGPRYRLRDVLAWLDGFPAASRPPQPKRHIGRPRIASSAQIAATRGKGVPA